MGKKRKAFHLDASLSAEQKVERLVEESVKKASTKDWNAAENMARRAVAMARESFYREEGHILHAKSNLQLGIVNLSRGHYAQARKPIEIAQKIAESNNDHWFRAKVYGAQADLCFIQKRKTNDFHKEGKRFRYLQEKEEEKARQKELSGVGVAGVAGVANNPPLPGGPAYEPPPPQGARQPPPYMHPNPYQMHPPPLQHMQGMHMGGMMRPPQGFPPPHTLPVYGMGPPRPPHPSSSFNPHPPMPPPSSHGHGVNHHPNHRFAPNNQSPAGPGGPGGMRPPQASAPAGSNPTGEASSSVSPKGKVSLGSAALQQDVVNGSDPSGSSAPLPPTTVPSTTSPSPLKAATTTPKSQIQQKKPSSTGGTSEMIWKEDITSMEEKRALHSKYSTP